MHNEASVQLEQLMPLIREQLASGQQVQFTTRGISMYPLLRNGKDQVILAPLPEKLKKFDLPLYQRDDGHYVLHRIVEVGETFSCVGDHQYEYETGIRQDQMLAIAVGFHRRGKYCSTHSFGYWLYVRFWHYTRALRRFLSRVKGFCARRMKKVFGK